MNEINLEAPISTMFDYTGSSSIALNQQTAEYSIDPNSLKEASTSSYNGYYWNYWEPYRNYYTTCYHSNIVADKFETAFKLSRKLMEKKLVKPMKTVEDFFKLMDSIVEVL